MDNRKQFLKNLIYAFGAQGISLLMSVFLTLVVPKVLGVTEYSYWQLFIFYIGYVGFFHFGYNDGVYLRLGGKDYSDLKYNELGTQFKIFSLFEIILAAIIIVIAFALTDDKNRKVIFIIAGIYMVLSNISMLFGYIFQSVNETRIFSISVIIDRIAALIFIFTLLLKRVVSFIPYMIIYTVSKGIAFLYCIYQGRQFIFSEITDIKAAIKDIWISISIGIKLMVSNVMSMLILGIGRLVIDNHWGIEQFGKLSLSLSLMNFFLLFIQQISMVMFPALRRTERDSQKQLYWILRILLGLLLPFVLVIYSPLKVCLSIWLPQYTESLELLAILLPICTFEGKMQMLCTTYLKVMREEKVLLVINIFSMLVSVLLCMVSGYLVNSLIMVAVSMVLSIMLRCILAELYLAKKMQISIIGMMFQEVLLVILFFGVTWRCSDGVTFFIMTMLYGIYIIGNKSKLLEVVRYFKHSKLDIS